MDLKTFQDNIKYGVTLVDFNAVWCAPCKAQEPIIRKLESNYKDRVSIYEIDIDGHRDLALKYMVQSIPTLIVFKDGQEVKKFVGLQSAAVLSKGLDEILDL
ncbi:MAG: thiol reductase thioredoxin [Desulfobacteraceae bacterium 4572_19]|nr:MAG: thiol reductase thioredoxin [Desulfobacteraceae bacterium 4572_19]